MMMDLITCVRHVALDALHVHQQVQPVRHVITLNIGLLYLLPRLVTVMLDSTMMDLILCVQLVLLHALSASQLALNALLVNLVLEHYQLVLVHVHVILVTTIHQHWCANNVIIIAQLA